MLARDWRSERGAAGIALTIVIAWALVAVLMLTSVLVSAQQIDSRVTQITGETGAIDRETDQVALLTDTTRMTQAILDAASPLSGQLSQVEKAAKSIDGTVVDILGNVKSIQATVNSIHGNANGILGTARSIDEGVAAINRKVVTALGSVNGIKGDTGGILGQVRHIDGHAASIDCNTDPGCVLVGGLTLGSDSDARPSRGRGGGGDPVKAVKKVVETIRDSVANILKGGGASDLNSSSSLLVGG